MTFNPQDIQKLYQPAADSHKGENGKVLVIGGSTLFHSSIFWSADVASRVVDMVHFSSPANENNELVRYQLKRGFWNGIVVDWGEIDAYVEEDDVVLIGPGMTRNEASGDDQLTGESDNQDNQFEGNPDNTAEIVNQLLKKYPEKKWVVDGGALQEVDPSLIREHHIITPHRKEMERLVGKLEGMEAWMHEDSGVSKVSEVSLGLNSCTILYKSGQTDYVVKGNEVVEVVGGNAGLTKGGTGDVLAGMVAALYAKNDAVLAASAASYLVKQAAETLALQRATFFNAEDLIREVGFAYGKLITS